MLRSAVIIYFSKKKSKTKKFEHAVKALPTPRGGNCKINYLHA